MPIHATGTHLKLVLKSCHSNPLNPHAQVSIVALHILGHPLTPFPPHPFPSTPSLLPPPRSSSSSLSHLSPPPLLPPELDLTTTQYVLHLSQLKAAAIDAEDYDTAKQMKERMERLLAEVPRLVAAEQRKRDAIEREDYDEAKTCKREVEQIRERALVHRHQPPQDERKEERTEAAVGRRRSVKETKGGEGAGGGEDPAPAAFASPRQLLDDDRPIKPAKSAMLPPPAHDEQPVGGGSKRAGGSGGAAPVATAAGVADDEAAFPVHAGDERPAGPDDVPAFAPPTSSAVYDEERPIKTRWQPQPEGGGASPRGKGEGRDDRAVPTSTSAAYPFDPSSASLPPSPSSAAHPTPEPIPASLSKEAEPLILLFGSLLTSQLLSRHWQLRVEALSTLTTLVTDPSSPIRDPTSTSTSVGGGGGGWVKEVGRVLQRVMADKVTQVFVAGARLLEALLTSCARLRGVKEDLRAAVDGVVKGMVDRLSSSSARERDQAAQVLLYLALHRAAPSPSAVPSALLHPLKKRDADHPTPLRARLLLLHSLLLHFGLSDAAGGMSQSALFRFTIPLLSHRDAGVRDAAFNVVASASVDGVGGGGRGGGGGVKGVEGWLVDVPAGPLAGVEARMEDVREGRVVFVRVEPPTSAYVERPVKEGAGGGGVVSTVVSPRRRGREEEEKDGGGEAPHSARKEKSVKRKEGGKHRQSEPPPSSHTNGHHGQEGGRGSPREGKGSKVEEKRSVGKGKGGEKEGEARKAGKEKKAAGQKKLAPPPPPPVEAAYTDEEEAEEYAQDHHGEEDEEGSHVAVPNAGSPSQYQLTHAAVSPPSPPPVPTSPPPQPPSPLPTQCQFCGLEDASFTEDALDLHYWQSCPMLLSCPHCEQVVEIVTLAEHLLGECEGEGEWRACGRCGWVVEARGVEEHEKECGGVKKGNAVCQLCCKEVLGTEDGWRHHLLDDGCSGNTRTAGLDTTLSD